MVPPFDELATFSVGFIVAVDADVISAHAAFAVEKSAGVSPSIVDFDLLEEGYVWRFGPLGGSSVQVLQGLLLISVTGQSSDQLNQAPPRRDAKLGGRSRI